MYVSSYGPSSTTGDEVTRRGLYGVATSRVYSVTPGAGVRHEISRVVICRTVLLSRCYSLCCQSSRKSQTFPYTVCSTKEIPDREVF